MKYSYLLLFFFIWACANENPKSENYNWIVGNWESTDGTSSETWNKISKQSYNGIGYAHLGDTTRIAEYLRLYMMDNKWTLEAKVIGQNKGKEITFIQPNNSIDSILTLENKIHDFPKSISYRLKHQDTLGVVLNKGLSNQLNYGLNRVEEVKNLNFIE